jgi:hypothetical protein
MNNHKISHKITRNRKNCMEVTLLSVVQINHIIRIFEVKSNQVSLIY